MEIRLGSAPDSWGVWFPSDPKQTPWHRFLDEVAAAGYEWIELGPYGYLPTDLDELRRELDRRRLKVSGTFAMAPLEKPEAWPELERQVTGAGALLQPLGARYLVLIDDVYTNLFTGAPVDPPQLDDAAWTRLIDTTHRIARLARDRFGLITVLHPHAETHIEYEQQIERFLADTDPALIFLCLDVGHHAYRGGDPVAFLRKHHARIPYLHFKSVRADLRERVKQENIPFAVAVGMDLFCEPKEGTVDFPALYQALREINYEGFAIVEQDMYPAPFDKPFPIAKRSHDYLVSLGTR